MAKTIPLPDYVVAALRALGANGYEAYVVGGAVRDALLGRRAGDYDMATNALPDDIARVFQDKKQILVGKAYGTVAVMYGHNKLEITTFRQDGGYADARHPGSVRFGAALQQDLARRDFTINAMAYNESAGIVDPFGGQRDLKNRVVRAVGEPKRRFSEDALRILRMARFCAKLNFRPGQKTLRAANELRAELLRLSAERVRDELSGFIVCKQAGARFLEFKQIFLTVLPELKMADGFLQHNPNHHLDVLGHTAEVINHAPPRLVLRLAALLHDVAKPSCLTLDETGRGHFYGHMKMSAAMAEQILKRLRYDNKTIRHVCKLISLHNIPREDSDKCARLFLRLAGPVYAFDLVDLMRADYLAHAPDYAAKAGMFDGLRQKIGAALQNGDCYSTRQLKVRGDDMIAVGAKKGPQVSRVLNALLDGVVAGEIKNERGELLRAARKMINANRRRSKPKPE